MKHPKRNNLLKFFLSNHQLLQLSFPKPTYHHFVGHGESDSNLDQNLYSSSAVHPETLICIECSKSNPLVNSHHDLIISVAHLPHVQTLDQPSDNVTAPIIENERMKIVWSDQGIEQYQALLTPHLHRLQQLWLSSPTKSCTSLLLESTNNLLTSCAAKTNKAFLLANQQSPRPIKTPRAVRKSQKDLLKMYKTLKKSILNGNYDSEASLDYSKARTEHRRLLRHIKACSSIKRDQDLFSVCSTTNSKVFSNIKRSRREKCSKINKLQVRNRTYVGESVKDGFFDSIRDLKTRNSTVLNDSEIYSSFNEDYKNIIEISKHGTKIPNITEKEAFKLLHKMKPNVIDLYGVTINHYKYGGPAGWYHFYILLNFLIDDISNTVIEEVNTVHAIILFKGHEKSRTSDRSYRTISTCPQVAKALDLYVRDLNITKWNKDQATTQFQGEGSSHELAAILLSETIQYSVSTLKEPVLVLYLDAQSAFDFVLHELLVRNLFICGTTGHSLLYLNNRLENRKTFIEWDAKLMGPISDEKGLEQGGVSSSDFYKVYGKTLLETAHKSELGASLGNLRISSIGQADDTAIIANDLHSLRLLLKLTQNFCKKFNVKLCAEKTKFQIFSPNNSKADINTMANLKSITLDDQELEPVEFAEHVGMVRTPSGNLPTIMTRISAHRRAVGAVLHAGLARSHRGNPAAGLHLEMLYGVPVLLSGLAALILSKSEEDCINQHYKKTISNIQRLLPRTPQSVIYFLAGRLPGHALLHMRQLSNFGMICRLTNNILHNHANNIFSFKTISKKSWFHRIRELCLQYQLPHPQELLNNPPKKEKFKSLIKKHILSYWEKVLRAEAAPLSSLIYFKPDFMSLLRPHPIWATAGSSPAKIAMATIQAHLLSGRYKTGALCRHWSTSNKEGFCLLSPVCTSIETLPHFLVHCEALHTTRIKLMKFTNNYLTNTPEVINHLMEHFLHNSSPEQFCQFLLDCSVIPAVISAVQEHGREILSHLFEISRTWVYTLHKERMKILGRWKIV